MAAIISREYVPTMTLFAHRFTAPDVTSSPLGTYDPARQVRVDTAGSPVILGVVAGPISTRGEIDPPAPLSRLVTKADIDTRASSSALLGPIKTSADIDQTA